MGHEQALLGELALPGGVVGPHDTRCQAGLLVPQGAAEDVGSRSWRQANPSLVVFSPKENSTMGPRGPSGLVRVAAWRAWQRG